MPTTTKLEAVEIIEATTAAAIAIVASTTPKAEIAVVNFSSISYCQI